MITEETLDPLVWLHHKELGYKMVDDIIDYLKNIEEKAVWQPIPSGIKQEFNKPLPIKKNSPEFVYEEAKKLAMAFPYGNIHPRFWAWINSPGTIMGVYAEMIAATINSNSIYGDHAAIHIENQVLEWIKSMYDLPNNHSAILVSGGSMANLYGLTVARNSIDSCNIQKEGLLTNKQLILYCSTETHNSIDKAIEVLGIGKDNIRKIPVNDDFTINLNMLKEKIAEDKRNGCFPFCVVANAGTVNTGAIDPLNDLADLCNNENIWLHIDGAYGLPAYLVDAEKQKFSGFERADSVAFDLHKWMYVNYSAGCVMFKSKDNHKNSFASKADYLMKHERGLSVGGGPKEFNHLGIELTRPNRTLKIWMSFKEHGIEKYARMIDKDIALAHYLKRQIEQNELFELMSPVNLSIVCFRFYDASYTDDTLNKINKEILMGLQEVGKAIISSTILNGLYVFRVAITNHRTKRKDIDIFMNSITNITKLYKSTNI